MNAAAAAAQIALATRASGTIVRVDPEGFLAILTKSEAPLVVHARATLAAKPHRYMTSYKGLAFFTKCKEPLLLPATTELIAAEKIWIP